MINKQNDQNVQRDRQTKCKTKMQHNATTHATTNATTREQTIDKQCSNNFDAFENALSQMAGEEAGDNESLNFE